MFAASFALTGSNAKPEGIADPLPSATPDGTRIRVDDQRANTVAADASLFNSVIPGFSREPEGERGAEDASTQAVDLLLTHIAAIEHRRADLTIGDEWNPDAALDQMLADDELFSDESDSLAK